MKYKKEYCFGHDHRDGEDDFVTAYIAENGTRIEAEFYSLSNNRMGYRVNGRGFNKLKEAKAYVEKEAEA